MHDIVQVLYEIATAYGNMTKGFSIHTIIPRELVPTTCRVKDIPSSVLIVEEVENAPDLLTFVREILESQAEVLKNVANPLFFACRLRRNRLRR